MVLPLSLLRLAIGCGRGRGGWRNPRGKFPSEARKSSEVGRLNEMAGGVSQTEENPMQRQRGSPMAPEQGSHCGEPRVQRDV